MIANWSLLIRQWIVRKDQNDLHRHLPDAYFFCAQAGPGCGEIYVIYTGNQ